MCSDVILALLLLVCLEADTLAATDLELLLRLGDVRSAPDPERLLSIRSTQSPPSTRNAPSFCSCPFLFPVSF